MTKKRSAKRRKLAHEVLGLIAISALFALIVYLILTNITSLIVQEYCFQYDVPMTEFDWIEVDRWIFGVGAVISVSCFSALFLAMFSGRLAYIRRITKGIDALRLGQEDSQIPLEGNNELTELAAAIGHMSQARQQLQQQERALAEEKDQLIRTLSHDIRTPLTSILAYSEYLASEDGLSAQERKIHLHMIRGKAQQIRELTDILLDGGKRSPEPFENARLLMDQLAQAFEAELEDRFQVCVDLSGCPAFGGTFDVQELRRIFDNLQSNAAKYADPEHPVSLAIFREANSLVIRQSNRVLPTPPQADSYCLGINSIRRIAQHYSGSVTVAQTEDQFSITIVLSDF